MNFKRDAGFGAESSRGTYRWLWSMVMPQPLCCASPSPVVLWYLVLVLPVLIGMGVSEALFRARLSADDGGRYGAQPAFFLMDVSFFTWSCAVFSAAVSAGYAIAFCGRDNADLRDETREMPPLAHAQWFAYTFALTSSAVEMVLYTAFAAQHHVHPQTSAFFAMTFTLMVIGHGFLCMHTHFEHVGWVLLAGWVYAFPISLAHYFTLPSPLPPQPYIYSVVNWAQPAYTILNIIGISFLTVGVHAAFAAWSQCKNARVLGGPYQARVEPITDAENLVAIPGTT